MLLIPTLAILAVQTDRPIVVEADRLRKDGAALVCKTKPRTNTRFGTRTCHTQAEWARITEENRRNYEEMVGGMRQNQCNGEGQCPGGGGRW